MKGNGNKNGQLKGNPDPVKEGKSPGVQKQGKLINACSRVLRPCHITILNQVKQITITRIIQLNTLKK